MEFTIYRASEACTYKPSVGYKKEFNTLEELEEFGLSDEFDLIIDFRHRAITIYDDAIE